MQADDLDGPVSRTCLARTFAARCHPYRHLAAAHADKVVGVPRHRSYKRADRGATRNPRQWAWH